MSADSVFPNPQRVRLMMLEKGIHDQFEEVGVNMIEKGDQRGWSVYSSILCETIANSQIRRAP